MLCSCLQWFAPLSELSFLCLFMCSGIADSGWAVPCVQHGSCSQADGGGEGAHGGAPYQPPGHATPWTHHCYCCCCHRPTCGLYPPTFSGVNSDVGVCLHLKKHKVSVIMDPTDGLSRSTLHAVWPTFVIFAWRKPQGLLVPCTPCWVQHIYYVFGHEKRKGQKKGQSSAEAHSFRQKILETKTDRGFPCHGIQLGNKREGWRIYCLTTNETRIGL